MAFPFVRQYDAMQCGISCMAMICRFHGKTFSLQWLEKHCGASREGVSLKALEDLGATMGLGCVAGKVRVKDRRDCPLPCILHWNQNHFVVLYKIDRDGTGLSQGQRQRILIARAVYRDPDFIFLDEATNALDARNERTIVENLGRFYRGRTVVVVAHRLSTVRNADNIVVIENGRIEETGSHAELIARKGAYFNLVRNQLELLM